MLFTRQIALKELADLCRRLGTALEAGLDIRKVLDREASGRSSRHTRERLEQVSLNVARGGGVYEGLRQTGSYFPSLFREMVAVGEQTGKLAEVFRKLADQYDHQVRMRRTFRAAIAWPMLQLSAAVVIIGFVIWVLGVIAEMNAPNDPIDILGFGLIGTPGLIIYSLFIGAIVFGVFLVIRATQRGLQWVHPLQRLVMRAPVLGPPLQTLALSRFAWALNVTTDTEMDLLKALPLSLRATNNAYFTDHLDDITMTIRSGGEIAEALDAAGVFPRDFVDAIEVGERAGQLPESMRILSANYQDQAERALATLITLAGFAVWGIVAIIIILLIIRIFSFYLGTLTSLSGP